ncbi:MAG: tRNA lysidine(34) synthetase TilS [Chlamydiota bacterium]|nr:tRNA lysidine(34) synthetase TilS [Chlamydiota bacterium]
MLDDIYAYICEQKLFIPREKVLIGVSGGSDSLALAHILHALEGRLELSLTLAYFDHALRPDDAAEDQQFIYDLAKQLNVPVVCGVWAHGPLNASLENEARKARYAFFRHTAVAHNISKIVLGHTLDDQAETILEHLLRGSGMRGLCGMKPIRDMDGLSLARPLLCTTRAKLRAYLELYHYVWREDRTNQDLRFFRNRVRHLLIPIIQKEFNANFQSSLVRLGEIMMGDEQILDSMTQEHLLRLVRIEGVLRVVAVKDLLELSLPLARRMVQALYQIISANQQLSFQHVQDILSLVRRGKSGKLLQLPGHVYVWLSHGLFYIGPEGAYTETCDDIHLEIPCKRKLSFAGGSLEVDLKYCETDEVQAMIRDHKTHRTRWLKGLTEGVEWIEYFDASLIKGPVNIRSFKPGDVYDPIGFQGASKKVKKIFSDEKIPNHKRKKIPVFVANDKIFWIGGYRISDSFKVSGKSSKILEMHLHYQI